VITGDQATRAPTGRGRRRAARPAWLRRVLMFSGVALLLVATAFGGEWVLTPSVGDAPQRVHAFAVDHRSTELSGPVPPKYAAALVATEDSRFYSHHGIDSLGVARAALGFLGKPDQGGSTLDQQLAKTLYSNGQRSPHRRHQRRPHRAAAHRRDDRISVDALIAAGDTTMHPAVIEEAQRIGAER